MEKIDILVWDSAVIDRAPSLSVPGLRGLAVSTAAGLPGAPLLMGRGNELAGYVEIWVDSVDVWSEIVAHVPGDAYLVTESVPPAPPADESLLTHFTWFPKPDRLTDEQFFHGWHVVHTPSSFRLHPRRQGYVRDAVTRPLNAGAPAVRAIVSEYFDEADYMDPSRLFAMGELETTVEELPLYADQADISSCPLWRRVVL